MNEKNNKKQRTSVLNSKNLTVIGITAVAVVLFAIIMTYIMPKSTENDKNFDNKAWREAVSEADRNNSSNTDNDSDAYGQASKPTNADALPAEANAAENIKSSINEKSAESTDSASKNENNAAENVGDSDKPTKSGEERPQMKTPVSGAVLNDYSGDNLVYSKTMNDWRTHNGIDFCANEGDEVYAAADGTVEAVTENGMLGKTIILLHENGIRTIYSNLAEEDFTAVGDNVLSGSVIGKVGNTAAAEVGENSHLHFEVSVNEETVNPHDYISLSSSESDSQE